MANKEKSNVILGKRPGKRLRNNPEVVAKELIKLRDKYGKLTTKIVLDEARSKKSALHNEFEWDDTVAAERYRIYQAACLITSISVHIINEPDSKPKRLLLGYKNDDGEHEYQTSDVVMASRDLSNRALAQAIRELEATQAKFEEISELTSVWKEVARVKRNAKKNKEAA